jgi:hypothetical protein
MDGIERVSPFGHEPILATEQATSDLERYWQALALQAIPSIPAHGSDRSAVDCVLDDGRGGITLVQVKSSMDRTRAELDRRGLLASSGDDQDSPVSGSGFIMAVSNGYHRANDLAVVTADDVLHPAPERTLDVPRQTLPVPAEDDAPRRPSLARSHGGVRPEPLDRSGGKTLALVRYLASLRQALQDNTEAMPALRAPWQLTDAELLARHQLEIMLLKLVRAVQASRCLPPPTSSTTTSEVSTAPCGVLRLGVSEVPRAPGRGGFSSATDHQRGAAA